MSTSLVGRNIVFKIKAGDRATLVITVLTPAGIAKDLTNTTTYATAKFKVWKTDGTLIINGAATYTDRPNGVISYTLQAADTLITNAGIWDGEVEMLDNTSTIFDQTETFTVQILDSY